MLTRMLNSEIENLNGNYDNEVKYISIEVQ